MEREGDGMGGRLSAKPEGREAAEIWSGAGEERADGGWRWPLMMLR